jgi:hypothetical protein
MEALLIAGRLAVRQSRSSTFVAPAPAAASLWRRAAASWRTARRSLAACPRSQSTFCRRASTWPCARSWGAIQGGASKTGTIAACRFSSLFVSLLLFTVFKAILHLGSSPKDSNPQPFAPLGSAPTPRAPRVLPPLSAPLPLTPAPPGALCSGSVAGTGGVATQHGTAASSRVSSCEPPSDQPQEACLPPHERRRCLCGGVSFHRACATAAQHARPHAVRLRAHRVSRF